MAAGVVFLMVVAVAAAAVVIVVVVVVVVHPSKWWPPNGRTRAMTTTQVAHQVALMDGKHMSSVWRSFRMMTNDHCGSFLAPKIASSAK